MPTATATLDLMLAMEAVLTPSLALAGADTTLGPILVDWGYPDPYSAADSILFIRTDATQDPATLGVQRSREETILFDIHFYSFRSTQKQAVQAAIAILKLVERYCRMTDPTLSTTNVIRQCLLRRAQAAVVTLPGDLAAGRGCEIIATFEAKARISG